MAKRRTPGEGAATVDDLIADAAERGIELKPRTITDWVARGLLDRPDRRSAGRGKGSEKGLFSANQRLLFHLLLVKREESERLTYLATLPLFIWAYWGDEYVPTRQARRALTTIAEIRNQPRVRAELKARDFVSAFEHSDANPTDVTKFRRLSADAIESGHVANPVEFEEVFLRVFDPNGEGRRIYPPGIPELDLSVSPTQLIAAAVRQHEAVEAFEQGKVTDAHLETARRELQKTFIEWASRNPFLVDAFGELNVNLAREHHAQDLADQVAQNIWLVLGAILDSEQPPPRRVRRANGPKS